MRPLSTADQVFRGKRGGLGPSQVLAPFCRAVRMGAPLVAAPSPPALRVTSRPEWSQESGRGGGRPPEALHRRGEMHPRPARHFGGQAQQGRGCCSRASTSRRSSIANVASLAVKEIAAQCGVATDMLETFASQLSRGELTLFTGAGFSLDAKEHVWRAAAAGGRSAAGVLGHRLCRTGGGSVLTAPRDLRMCRGSVQERSRERPSKEADGSAGESG